MLAGHNGILFMVVAVGISCSADLYHWPAMGGKKKKKTHDFCCRFVKIRKGKNPDNRHARHTIMIL